MTKLEKIVNEMKMYCGKINSCKGCTYKGLCIYISGFEIFKPTEEIIKELTEEGNEPEPDVVHYNEFPRVPFCETTDGKEFTSEISKVTCPKCLEILKYEWIYPGEKCFFQDVVTKKYCLATINSISSYGIFLYCDNRLISEPFEKDDIFPVKYVPWTFDTSPYWFEDENGLIYSKHYHKDSSMWGFASLIRQNWKSFKTCFEMKQKDGTPCGNPVPDLEYYKQFDR